MKKLILIEESKAAVNVCQKCGHLRRDHCCCGSVCMKCSCSRFRNDEGLAPCAECESRNHLVRMDMADGRSTYRCVSCHPLPGRL